MTGEPARTPLPRPVQRHPIELYLNAMAGGVRRHLAIGREQGQLGRALRRLIERLDDPAPSRPLAVVDLAQIKHRPLHHLAARAAPVLGDAPVAVFLAIFLSRAPTQKHDGS